MLPSRSVLEVVLQDREGDARQNVALTFRNGDNSTPISQTIYDAVSGGSAVVSPATNSNGTFRGWVDNPQAAYVVSADDSVSTPIAAWPSDPSDLILTAQSNRHLTSLRLGSSGTPGATGEVMDSYNGWGGATITQNYNGFRSDVGGFGIADQTRPTDNVSMIEAIAGAINVPAGATSIAANGQAIGVAGYAKTASANAVAVYADARAAASNVGLWAFNCHVLDRGFEISNGPMHGMEVNCISEFDGNIFWGVDAIAAAAYDATAATGFGAGVFLDPWVAFKVRPCASGASLNVQTKWHTGFHAETNSALFAINLDPATSGNGSNSNVIRAVSKTSGGTAREAYLFTNQNGEWAIRPGTTTIARLQATNNDQSATGTTHHVFTTTGYGINLPSEAVPGKPFEVYATAASFNMVARLTNYNSGGNVGPFLGFDATGGAETQGAKAGIGLARNATFGRGDLHFVINADANATEVGFTDSAGFIASNKGWVIGAGTSGGAGTLVATGVIQSAQGVATTANGAQALQLGASGPHIYVGSGAPSVSAPQGSLYLRTDGSSSSTRLYVNSTGSTTWVAITTAS